MDTVSSPIDRIEQQIDIDATPQRVWELISTPGWWINEGEIIEHRIEREGSRAVVHDPIRGEFVLQVEALESPRYAAYRWFSGPPAAAHADAALDTRASTLVEFWIDERDGGGVSLRVAESGFEGLDRTAEERRKMFDDNTEGWTLELAAARSFITGA